MKKLFIRLLMLLSCFVFGAVSCDNGITDDTDDTQSIDTSGDTTAPADTVDPGYDETPWSYEVASVCTKWTTVGNDDGSVRYFGETINKNQLIENSVYFTHVADAEGGCEFSFTGTGFRVYMLCNVQDNGSTCYNVPAIDVQKEHLILYTGIIQDLPMLPRWNPPLPSARPRA